MTTVVVDDSVAASVRVLGLPRGYSRCDARRIQIENDRTRCGKSFVFYEFTILITVYAI